jgi:molecular chaperone GrpE
MSSAEETNAGPVIRDLRRIDPQTGQVRNPGADASGAARGPAKPARPGRHSVSKPGGAAGGPEAAAAAGSPGDGTAADPGQGPASGGGSGPGQGPASGGGPGPGQPSGGNAGGAGQAEPGSAAQAGPAAGGQDLAAQLAERTADLQRVTAEYANYRKRVDRDRLAVREQALANVLSSLIPVLDDIGRARDAGELTGGFKSVAESLTSAVTKLGLSSFGTEGEPFDPKVHEALTHSYSAGLTEPTCVQILQPGYKVGERILRPARVAVAEPDDSAGAGGAGDHGAATGEPGPGGTGAQENREDDD